MVGSTLLLFWVVSSGQSSSGAGAASGVATATATGRAEARASGSSAAAATSAAAGASAARAGGSVAGAASTTASARLAWRGTGSVAGVADTLAGGRSRAAASGLSVGVAAVFGVGSGGALDVWRGLMTDTTYNHFVGVTPSDSADLPDGLSDGLYVGGAGTVVVEEQDGTSASFSAVAGAVLPIRVRRVRATGTTASAIVALYRR